MYRKSLTSVGELIDKIAREKQAAAISRFRPRDPSTERPGDVFSTACEQIARQFPEFKYARSGPHFSRKSGEFVFRVSFQSSHNNVSGALVALRVSAGVLCPALKKWRGRQASPMSTLENVGGGGLGSLRSPISYLEWNLEPADTRASAVADAASAIREFALPYFVRFEDREKLLEELISSDIPGVWIQEALELLLCFRDRASAGNAAQKFLGRRPDVVREYSTVLERFRAGGLPKYRPTGYAQMVAWAVLAYGLEWD